MQRVKRNGSSYSADVENRFEHNCEVRLFSVHLKCSKDKNNLFKVSCVQSSININDPGAQF